MCFISFQVNWKPKYCLLKSEGQLIGSHKKSIPGGGPAAYGETVKQRKTGW